MPVATKDYQFSVISSKPQALHDWALSLKERYPDKPVAVACELKKGPLIYALSRYAHITIFPINPSTVAKYRKAFTQSGAKNKNSKNSKNSSKNRTSINQIDISLTSL